MAAPGQLQEFVARQGGAAALLHDGPGQTRDIEAELCLTAPRGDNAYRFRLAYASGDTFIYTDEAFKFVKPSATGPLNWTTLGAGHRESKLVERAERGERTPAVIQNLLRKIIIHQFHNTSDVARVRQKWDVEENRWLKEDAGNLAPFLLRLKHHGPTYYHRIVETIRLALPFFADFDLLPENGRVLLKWRERGSDLTFHAGQAADGMLRFLMLVALLQQPESDLPDVLVLDEPELGLHPFAISIIADLLKAASRRIQVIVATQSVSLIDRFAAEDLVIVSRDDRTSSYRRLEPHKLREWLEEYTLSELWEKNVIGGRP